MPSETANDPVKGHANSSRRILIVVEDRDFDLLQTDVVSPGEMNGREIAEAVRRRFPAVKRLFLTGRPKKPSTAVGTAMPAQSKPCRREVLTHMARDILDQPQC